jgi:uncharacterized protein YecE (DUF72 family)
MPDDQLALFVSGPLNDRVRALEPDEELRALGAALPSGVKLGTSSWSFSGWDGLVYDGYVEAATLAREGLGAYAAHPLLRTVGIDRTWYSPIKSSAFQRYAEQVPEGFQFLVKAHQLCTYLHKPDRDTRKPPNARNPLFLNRDYALAQVVEPYIEGLQKKGGVLLFQFAPQDFAALGGPAAFTDALGEFFSGLPRGPRYAVEIRNRECITADYGEVLRELGIGHCAVVYPRMPAIETQSRIIAATKPSFVVARWMLQPKLNYTSAVKRYAPFATLRDPDIPRREALARLVRQALAADVPALVIVNNKAEGCAPESIRALARAIIEGA